MQNVGELAVISIFILFYANSARAHSGGVLQFEDILPEDPSSYDKMRPPKKEGKPTVVHFHVTVMSIDSINENSMTYAADIFFAQSWRDYRLRLPENMTSDYRLLEVDWLDQMWRPDSYFKNAKQVTFQTMTIPNHYVWLYQSKSILYMVKLTLTLSCSMNYAIYPHDTQECKLQMESLSHTTEDLIFEWDPDVPLVVDHIELPQFDLVRNRTADCSQVYSTGNFTCLEVVFILKRRLGYYLFHTYMPTCLIVIMSWVSFWIKPEAAPARVTLGVTSLLTLSTQHAKSQASLPPVSYIKIIDMFMSTCTIFVFLALMEYALVNVVLGDGPEGVNIYKPDKTKAKKSRFFLPTLLNDVKKRYKITKSGITQALNLPLASSTLYSASMEEDEAETKFQTTQDMNKITASHLSSHIRKHSATPVSEPHCQNIPYSIHNDIFSAQDSPNKTLRVCHHADCHSEPHHMASSHHCTDTNFYNDHNHSTEICCEDHSPHNACSASFPQCAHLLTPHICHGSYVCLPHQCMDRETSHCSSSICSPQAGRSSSYANIYSHSYYVRPDQQIIEPDRLSLCQQTSASCNENCSRNTCTKVNKPQINAPERRSRSVDRTSEKQLTTRSRRGTKKPTEVISDRGQKKSINWPTCEAEVREIRIEDPPQEIQSSSVLSIQCESSNSLASSNPPPTGETAPSNFQAVPTPPPPPKASGPTKAQKRRTRAIMVDRFSRIFFPLTFGLLNAIYWLIFWIYL